MACFSSSELKSVAKTKPFGKFLIDAGSITTKGYGSGPVKFELNSLTRPVDELKDHLSNDDFHAFIRLLLNGLKEENIVPTNLKKVQGIAATVYMFGAYTQPFHHKMHPNVIASTYYMTGLTVYDDVFEQQKSSEGQSLESFLGLVQDLTSKIIRILTGKETEEERKSKSAFENAETVLHCFRKYVEYATQAMPDYVQRCGPVLKESRFLFDINMMHHIVDYDIAKSISPDCPNVIKADGTFEFLRRWDVGARAYLAMISLPNAAYLEEEVMKLPEFKRMLEAFCLALGYANDLYSFKNEYDYENEFRDNTFCIRNSILREIVLRKGTVFEAVKKTANGANSEIKQVEYLSAILMERFPDNEILAAFIRHLGYFYDGGLQAHVASNHRYTKEGDRTKIRKVDDDGNLVKIYFRDLAAYEPEATT